MAIFKWEVFNVWETPIYPFMVEKNGKKERVFIDVTGSAPNFKTPMKQLEGTFDVLLEGLEPSKTTILDFGAAKLRNTVYLLEKGFTVYACEFKDLFARSQQAKQFMESAEKYPNFKKLVFPDDFIHFDEKFDVVMLINVLNIMPVPEERFLALKLCRERMRENGRLLWYTQHGGYDFAEYTKLNDGIITGKGRTYHMFYRNYSRNEIHNMLFSTGFSFNKDFKFPMSGANQAYVFKPDKPILVAKTLELDKMLKKEKKLKEVERKVTWSVESEDKATKTVAWKAGVPRRTTKLEKIDVLKILIEELDTIPTGRKNARKYHELIFNILTNVFKGKLKNGANEYPVADRTKLIDIRFRNIRGADGFFCDLSEVYKRICPNIFFECKNYENRLGNPEFAQIATRLNKNRGQFGAIVCRKIHSVDSIKPRLREMREKEEYVIVLEDADIKKIVEMKLAGNEEGINDFLDDKYNEMLNF